MAVEILSRLPGRLRLHCPGSAGSPDWTMRLQGRAGVRTIKPNPWTENVLVEFDASQLSEEDVVEALSVAPQAVPAPRPRFRPPEPQAPPPAGPPPKPSGWARGRRLISEKTATGRRYMVHVHGLDRDPGLASHVVERLNRHAGVTAVASPLTGRVFVEFAHDVMDVAEILGELARVELPPLPHEDVPSHPLDRTPLFQSAIRTIGAAVGLGAIAVQKLMGIGVAPGLKHNAAQVAGWLGLAQSFPSVRQGLRRLLGRSGAALAQFVPMAVSLVLSDGILGLTLTCVEAGSLLSEVRARRNAWKRYEERLGDAPSAVPGAILRVESGQRAPRLAKVVEGHGVATGRSGRPESVSPGDKVSAGSRLRGGPFVLELLDDGGVVEVQERRHEPAPTLYSRYLEAMNLVSLGYSLLTLAITRSPARAFVSLLLVNPRPALIATEMADIGADSRVLRAGVVKVGTRPHRYARRMDAIIIEGARSLTDGFELTGVIPFHEHGDPAQVLQRAAAVALAAGSPWGSALPTSTSLQAQGGRFDGVRAEADLDGEPLVLHSQLTPEVLLRLGPQEGNYCLTLRGSRGVEGVLLFRPRLQAATRDLVQLCRQHNIELELLSVGDPVVTRAVSERSGIPLVPPYEPMDNDPTGAMRRVEEHQMGGCRVAIVSDNHRAASAFNLADLAIGLSTGMGVRFAARADFLAPDIAAVMAIVEAGIRHQRVQSQGVFLSIAANLFGAAWGFRTPVAIERASLGVYAASLAAAATSLYGLRGGHRSRVSLAYLNDPRPERWGQRSVEQVLTTFKTSEHGLTSEEAQKRTRRLAPVTRSSRLLGTLGSQLTMPINMVLAGAATLTLGVGVPLEFALLMATIGLNVAVGTWQEYKADKASEALEVLSTPNAIVLRDGKASTVLARQLVTGDVMLLAPGDRISADGRLIESRALEIDEASMTGESYPVRKAPRGGLETSRIVLAGTDVVVGHGRAVVVATGRKTRLGAMAAALSQDEASQSPLGQKLSLLFRRYLPYPVTGAGITMAAGFFFGRPLLPQLATAATIGVAALPEGLPLLAGVGEAAAARRLAKQGVNIRRLTSVEALGRVDVACTDKTGTLTQGRLAVRLVALEHQQFEVSDTHPELPNQAAEVLRIAALACPPPGSHEAKAHPTDRCILQAAFDHGVLPGQLERLEEVPFDPNRGYHATVTPDAVYVKGAPEIITPLCDWVREGDQRRRLHRHEAETLLRRAHHLADQGLRILMVATGPANGNPQQPAHLTCEGFVGIRDPIRPQARESLRRCREAGIRVVMLTGDHPATARAIAVEAGLEAGENVLTGNELSLLTNRELDERLQHTSILARVTPLDKLRIIESLQRCGHVVAMTGDGVNDAPALRLADVGVAMGQAGTEVARQAADVVLQDDNFETLVEALLEGRSYWRNLRRALGLLLGGNLGELGLVVGASALGCPSPLSTPQILITNLLTDALPALSVVVQKPEYRHLRALSRESGTAWDGKLRQDVTRRGLVTGIPALAAYLFMLQTTGNLEVARTVAFTSVVGGQLAQTLDSGRAEGSLTQPVLLSVGGSLAVLASSLGVPALRAMFGFAPTTMGMAGLAAAGAGAALVMNHLLTWIMETPPAPAPEAGWLVPAVPNPA